LETFCSVLSQWRGRLSDKLDLLFAESLRVSGGGRSPLIDD